MRLLVLFVVALLAGCTAPDAPADDVVVPPGLGNLQGVIVDEAIRPIAQAVVRIATDNLTATTDETGAFAFDGLAPGSYLVEASHPLFDRVQVAVDVLDGQVATARLQLTRQIFATPYSTVQAFDGYLVCSVGFFVYASEECGEGVGVPCEVPVLGCQRVGGSADNRAQWDFYLDGPFVRTLVVDMTWTSSSPTFDDAYLVLATDWTCDPFCIGNELNITTGGNPLYLTDTITNGTTVANTGNVSVTAETRFSTFVWPDWGHGDPTNADVAVNQRFQIFATAFYYLPAPDGWSFLDQA